MMIIAILLAVQLLQTQFLLLTLCWMTLHFINVGKFLVHDCGADLDSLVDGKGTTACSIALASKDKEEKEQAKKHGTFLDQYKIVGTKAIYVSKTCRVLEAYDSFSDGECYSSFFWSQKSRTKIIFIWSLKIMLVRSLRRLMKHHVVTSNNNNSMRTIP